MIFRIPFLSKHRNGSTSETPVVEEQQPGMTANPISEELFVDREAHEVAAARPAGDALTLLAAEDLTDRGYRDGYTYHDPEVRYSTLEAIKAGIRKAIELELAELVQQMGRLDVHIRQLTDSGMDSTLYALTAKREQMERQAMKLREELLQATGGCGYAELPCSTYTNGFNRGYKAYLAAEFLANTYAER